jgi:hypothetical protein
MFTDGDLVAPPHDVVELTVFGLGFGEAAVVHVGGGHWMIVDSCRRGNVNVPLKYLESLQVDLRSVRAIVATHWDMDHVDGLAEQVEKCPNAWLFTPGALAVPEVMQHVVLGAPKPDDPPRRFRKATQEYGAALLAVARRKQTGGAGWRPAAELQSLLRCRDIDGVGDVMVEALSPSGVVIYEAVAQVAGLIELLLSEENRGRVNLSKGLHPNDLSIALWVRAGDRQMLLGADLEHQNNAPGRGWRAIVELGDQRDCGPDGQAEAVKIPHHGSQDADYPGMWTELVSPHPVAIVAPWINGGHFLPSSHDLERLLERCGRIWVASRLPNLPGVEQPARPPIDLGATGYVRARSPARGMAEWTVTAGGTAFCHE